MEDNQELNDFLDTSRSIEFNDEQKAIVDQLIERERAKGKSLKRQIKTLQNELVQAENRHDFVAGIRSSDRPDIPPITAKKGKKSKTDYPSGEGTLVFVASDWHVEERVDPATVNDRNNYSTEIAWRRARQYFQSCLWILGKERKGAVIDTVILALLGDFITGYIHEEFLEINSMAPLEATQVVADMLTEGIDRILAEGDVKRLVIPCCYGNHGRTNPKKVITTAAANSFEWNMYYHLAQRFRKDKRVEFHIASGYHLYIDVYDTKIRFHHGDHVKYGGGVGGLTIPLNKKIGMWNRNIPADLDVLGHFHQLFDGGNFVVNGSLIGWNAYGISIGAGFEPPQQVGFLVRPGRGKCETFKIFVDKERALSAVK